MTKHTPSSKLALEDVLKSLQDLIRNDLPAPGTTPVDAHPTAADKTAHTTVLPASAASEVLRELEAELEAMPSAEELDLPGPGLTAAEEISRATDDGTLEEITLAEPPASEEIALPDKHSEYLQDDAPVTAELSLLDDDGLDISDESFVLEAMPEELSAGITSDPAPASEYLQDDAPASAELSVLEDSVDMPAAVSDSEAHAEPMQTAAQTAGADTPTDEITDDFLKLAMPMAELAENDEPTGLEKVPSLDAALTITDAYDQPGAKTAAIPPEGLQVELSFDDPAPPPVTAGSPVNIPSADSDAIPYDAAPATINLSPPTAAASLPAGKAGVNWQDVPVLEDAVELPGHAPAVTAPGAPRPAATTNKPAASQPASKNDQSHKIAIQAAARLNMELRRSGKRALGSDIITRLARVLEETLAQAAPNMDNTPKRKD